MSSDGIMWAFRQRNVPPATKLVLVVMGDDAAPIDGEDGPLWYPHNDRWLRDRTSMTGAELRAAIVWLQERGYIEPYDNVYSTWERGRKDATFRRVVESGWLLRDPENDQGAGR